MPGDKETYEQWKERIGKLNPNLAVETPDYDLHGAYEAGLEPTLQDDGTYHLASRNPQTGLLLKYPGHESYQQMLDAEKNAGYEVYSMNGRQYSRPVSSQRIYSTRTPEPVEITDTKPSYLRFYDNWMQQSPIDRGAIEAQLAPAMMNMQLDDEQFQARMDKEVPGETKRIEDNRMMYSLYQSWLHPQERDDRAIAESQMRERFGISINQYRLAIDPDYKQSVEIARRKQNITPGASVIKNDVQVPYNAQWMFPQLTDPEIKMGATEWTNDLLTYVIPIPGLEAMGKIPSLFGAAKKVAKAARGAEFSAAKQAVETAVNQSPEEVAKALKEIEYAREYFGGKGYNIRSLQDDLAYDPEALDLAIKEFVGQENTFVRGVNLSNLEYRDANIKYFEDVGFDWMADEEATARYMLARISPQGSGGGYAGLSPQLMDMGYKAAYSSNSLHTAREYTYGGGYYARVRRKGLDFSSQSRIDWIKKNQLDYLHRQSPSVGGSVKISYAGKDIGAEGLVKKYPFFEKLPWDIIDGNKERSLLKAMDYLDLYRYTSPDMVPAAREAVAALRDPNLSIDFIPEAKILKHYTKEGTVLSDDIITMPGMKFSEENKYIMDRYFVGKDRKTLKKIYTNIEDELNESLRSSFEETGAMDILRNALTKEWDEINEQLEKTYISQAEADKRWNNHVWGYLDRNPELKDMIHEYQDKATVAAGEKFFSELDKAIPGWMDTKFTNRYAHYTFIGRPGEEVFDVLDLKKVTKGSMGWMQRFHEGYNSPGLSMATSAPLVPAAFLFRNQREQR